MAWPWKLSAAMSLIAGMLLTFCGLMTWVTMYSEDVDPKNSEYVLWTHGLNQNMNLDHAVDAMTHDKKPWRLVMGLSTDQLRSRFGYIRTLDESLHLGCYPANGFLGTWAGGKEVVFLRNSHWMVILDHGK